MSEPHVPGYCGGEEPKTVCSDHERIVSVEAAEVAAAVAEIEASEVSLAREKNPSGVGWSWRISWREGQVSLSQGGHASIPAALAAYKKAAGLS